MFVRDGPCYIRIPIQVLGVNGRGPVRTNACGTSEAICLILGHRQEDAHCCSCSLTATEIVPVTRSVEQNRRRVPGVAIIFLAAQVPKGSCFHSRIEECRRGECDYVPYWCEGDFAITNTAIPRWRSGSISNRIHDGGVPVLGSHPAPASSRLPSASIQSDNH